jgi:hypothetical protein
MRWNKKAGKKRLKARPSQLPREDCLEMRKMPDVRIAGACETRGNQVLEHCFSLINLQAPVYSVSVSYPDHRGKSRPLTSEFCAAFRRPVR